MASLTFHSWHYFTRNGDSMGGSFTPGYDPSTVTEASPDIDSYLVPGESSLTNDWGGGPTTFHGLLDFGGRTFMVFQDTTYGYFLASVDMNVPDNEFPTNWSFSSVSSTGTDTVFMCFARGTSIATPSGNVAVETLSIGDRILSADGREVPVKWIGRQTVLTLFGPAERLRPVRFAAGALGNGLPHSDLTVTADHGMLIEGVICHAGALVNGMTITRVPLEEMGETYTVYHIETEAHEIILANGAPAETFIDNVSRRAFDNYAEFEALYGEVPEMEELAFPRAMSARQVPERLKATLASTADAA